MWLNRRNILRFAGSVALTGFAGCSAPFTAPPNLDLTIENYRNESVELLIEVVRPDAANRSEGLVYQRSVEVSSNAVGDDEWRAANIAPARQYRIEILLQSGEKTYHYHYHPDCVDNDPQYDPRVTLIFNENPGVSFQQTHCSGQGGSAP